MADAAPDTTTDLEPLYRQLLQQTLTQQQPWQQPQTPVERSGVSLLGEALGGGSQYGSPAERESAGTRALLSLGVGMLGASGYSPVRRTLGEVVATGIGGAQESLARSGSVAAAQLGAQQEYAQKQQEMQLARIKEAVPLLTALQTLQQQKRVAGMPSSLAPGTSIGAVGGDTYEGAIGGHEGTGKNPNSSALGTGQFLESTWQAFAAANPDLFKGMSPAQVLAARTDPALGARGITWLAQQNADALTKAGVTPTGPSLGIAHYLGAGATAKLWAAPDNAPVAGFVSADAVKANPELATMTVGQLKARYANTPAPAFLAAAKPGAPAPAAPVAAAPKTPPAGSTPPAQTAFVPGGNLPYGAPGPAPTAPGAPLVPPVAAAPRTSTTLRGTGTAATPAVPGGNQQLSEGEPVPAPYRIAGTDTGPPSSSFGIIGQAARAAEEGTTTATAVPAPQAATQATPQPQAPPAVDTTPPATTPIAQGPPTFTYTRHDPPPGMLQGSKLTSEEQSVVQDARNAYQNAIRVAITPEQRQQAEATLQATLDKELTARAGRTEAAGKQLADWYASDFKQQQEAHKQAVDSFYKNQDQQQQFANQLRLEQTKGEQTRLTNKEAVFNQANQKGLETAQTDQAAARSVVAQLEGFRNISEGVGQPGWLQTTKWPGSDHTIAEQLQQAGIPVADTGGAQLLKGGMINIVKALREGMPMGSLSDRDLSFIERMGPTEWMDPDTRAAAIGYLLQANRAKMRFASDVQKEMSRGKNYGDAVDAVDAKSKPFVPQVPADLTAHWTDDTKEWSDARKKWSQDNDAGPGTLIHMDDGRIVVLKRPPRKDRGQG